MELFLISVATAGIFVIAVFCVMFTVDMLYGKWIDSVFRKGKYFGFFKTLRVVIGAWFLKPYLAARLGFLIRSGNMTNADKIAIREVNRIIYIANPSDERPWDPSYIALEAVSAAKVES